MYSTDLYIHRVTITMYAERGGVEGVSVGLTVHASLFTRTECMVHGLGKRGHQVLLHIHRSKRQIALSIRAYSLLGSGLRVISSDSLEIR